MNRRTLLKSTAALAAGSPLLGIDPIERTGKPKLKLSLAAYSFRRQLTAKPGTPGAMDMLGFIDWASNQDLDAVEPTSYFFPKEITPEYLAELRRRAHLPGPRHLQRRHPQRLHPTRRARAGQVARSRRHLDRPLRRHRLPHHPRLRREGPKGVSEKEAIDNAVRNLEKACERAGRKGIILALENHDFLMDSRRLTTIVERVQSHLVRGEPGLRQLHRQGPLRRL